MAGVVIVDALPDPAFWRGRRVLVTGHTGFKGSWLSLWLARMGAQTTGLARQPATTPNLFEAARVADHLDSRTADIRDPDAVAAIMRETKPEIVFHLAAQPLVRESYRQPVDTFAANLMGTVHVLDALRQSSRTRVAVMVTTDKVYANREWVHPYRENDALGGHDPYSASKAACELAIASYRLSFLAAQGIGVSSVRAGNVVGGGDWSADRLLPDAVRAWEAGVPLVIRRPDAIRPWQHVLEPLAAYLRLAQGLWLDPTLAQAFNIGPVSGQAASVATVVASARRAFGRGDVIMADHPEGPHESGRLVLDASQAAHRLGIVPMWDLDQTVARTMGWYRSFGEGGAAADLCEADFEAFGKAAVARVEARPPDHRRAC